MIADRGFVVRFASSGRRAWLVAGASIDTDRSIS